VNKGFRGENEVTGQARHGGNHKKILCVAKKSLTSVDLCFIICGTWSGGVLYEKKCKMRMGGGLRGSRDVHGYVCLGLVR
jgi:hypothetical protein